MCYKNVRKQHCYMYLKLATLQKCEKKARTLAGSLDSYKMKNESTLFRVSLMATFTYFSILEMIEIGAVSWVDHKQIATKCFQLKVVLKISGFCLLVISIKERCTNKETNFLIGNKCSKK